MFPRLAAKPIGVRERLRRVIVEMQRLKDDREAETINRLQHDLPEAPPIAMAAARVVGAAVDPTAIAARWPLPVWRSAAPRPAQAGFNFTLTNVAGSNWTQYVAGYRVINAYWTLMLGGNPGLGVTVNSYHGKLAFGFTADPRLLPDVDRLKDLVLAAFEELLASARPSKSVPPPTAARFAPSREDETRDRAA